jgi:deoxyribose-phosphate aldolase
MSVKLLKSPEDDAVIKRIVNNMDNAQLLVPEVCTKMVDRVCEESIHYGFNSVVATPNTVERTAALLKGSPVHTLFGFGDAGRGSIQGKLETLKHILPLGVQEVDMIMNMPRFFDSQFDVVQSDISAIVKVCADYKVGVKVIIESGLLTDEQRKTAVELAIAGGAEYIKTASGGAGSGTCNMRLILFLREAIAGRAKLKASSGIQTLEDAWAFMEAGADRTAGRDNMTAQLKALGYKPSK